MTLHDYGYLPPEFFKSEIFKYTPCFRVKFSNIHPASEFDFLSEIFLGNLLLCKFLLLC